MLLFAAIGENGLNTTPNVSVLRLGRAGPGRLRCGGNRKRASQAEHQSRGCTCQRDLSHDSPSRLPGSAPCSVRLLCPDSPPAR